MFAPLTMLLSAVLHAVWNVGLRRERDPAAAGLVLFAIGCALILSVAGIEAAWFGMPRAEVAVRWGLAAGLSEAGYLLCLSRSLAIGPLASVYAISRGLPLVLLWPLSHVLLGEPVGLHAVVAVVLLLSGLIVLLPDAAGRTTTPRGYLWASLTALFNTTNALVYKAGVSHGAPVLLLAGLGLFLAMPVAALAARPQATERMRAALHAKPLRLTLEGAALGASFALATITMRTQGAAWVLTLRNASIGFAPLLAWSSLGERPSNRALAGVALVFAGALALGLGGGRPS